MTITPAPTLAGQLGQLASSIGLGLLYGYAIYAALLCAFWIIRWVLKCYVGDES